MMVSVMLVSIKIQSAKREPRDLLSRGFYIVDNLWIIGRYLMQLWQIHIIKYKSIRFVTTVSCGTKNE